MGPESIRLSVLEGGLEGTYSFICPVCSEGVEKQADRKIVALLVSAGCSVASSVSQPAAPPALPVEGPPPFDLDDLMAFHDLLKDDAALERFLSER